MLSEVAGFDWDAGNWPKCGKHGLAKREIEDLFARRIELFDDLEHGDAETRIKAIGRSADERHVFVVFTLRERDGRLLIRPISARHMHRKEVEAYEQA